MQNEFERPKLILMPAGERRREPESALFNLLYSIDPQLNAVYARSPKEIEMLTEENPIVAFCKWVININRIIRERFPTTYENEPENTRVDIRVNSSECSQVFFFEVAHYDIGTSESANDGEGYLIFISNARKDNALSTGEVRFRANIVKSGEVWEEKQTPNVPYANCLASIGPVASLHQYVLRTVPTHLTPPFGGRPMPILRAA